jgi:hypothetical protein
MGFSSHRTFKDDVGRSYSFEQRRSNIVLWAIGKDGGEESIKLSIPLEEAKKMAGELHKLLCVILREQFDADEYKGD